MITFAWQKDLDRAELAEVEELLAEAVSYDAEAGFSTADPRMDRGALTRHLLVRMPPRGERGSVDLDRLPDVSVVAYLRVDVTDGEGALQFVVRPDFRSLGVGTLLFERLRDEGGWAEVPGLTAVRTWAHGAHPAADRMAMRLGATVTDAWFKTLRFIGGSEPFVPAERDLEMSVRGTAVVEATSAGHRSGIAPADVEVLAQVAGALAAGDAVVSFGAGAKDPAIITLSATESTSRATARALLTRALLELQVGGARSAQFYVDPLMGEVLSASRELEFQHDQSDLHYVLPLDL